MGDLKSPWMEQGKDPVDAPGLGGDGVISRGGDPNFNGGQGDAALQTPWPTDKYATTNTQTNESANSVSGLPGMPSRWEPSDNPPQPPTLQDRMPGTIDEK